MTLLPRCSTPGCQRQRLPRYALCEDHVRALMARIFGPSATWRSVAA